MSRALKKTSTPSKFVPNKCQHKGCKCKGKADAWYSSRLYGGDCKCGKIEGPHMHFCADAHDDRRVARIEKAKPEIAAAKRLSETRAKERDAPKKKTLRKKESTK